MSGRAPTRQAADAHRCSAQAIHDLKGVLVGPVISEIDDEGTRRRPGAGEVADEPYHRVAFLPPDRRTNLDHPLPGCHHHPASPWRRGERAADEAVNPSIDRGGSLAPMEAERQALVFHPYAGQTTDRSLKLPRRLFEQRPHVLRDWIDVAQPRAFHFQAVVSRVIEAADAYAPFHIAHGSTADDGEADSWPTMHPLEQALDLGWQHRPRGMRGQRHQRPVVITAQE